MKTRILESSAESTRTTVEWLGTKCEAMQLKIKYVFVPSLFIHHRELDKILTA